MAIKSIAPTVGTVQGEWELEKFKVSGKYMPDTGHSYFTVSDTVPPQKIKDIDLFPEDADFDGLLEKIPISKYHIRYYRDAFDRLETLNQEFCQKYYQEYCQEMKDASDKYCAEHKEEIQAELDRLHKLGDEFRNKYFE